MTAFRHGIGLTLVAAALVATPLAIPVAASGTTTSPATTSPKPSLLQQARADGATTIRTQGSTGAVGFAAGRDLLPSVQANTKQTAVAKTDAYLDQYAPLFGAPSDQLQRGTVVSDSSGWTVDYTQRYQGVPVFGAELRAHVSKTGALTAVNGDVTPSLNLGVTPRLTLAQAKDRALAMVEAAPTGYAPDARPIDYTQGLAVAKADLEVYRMGAIQGVPGRTLLAYVVEVSNQRNVRETVVLDADTGKPVNRYSMIDQAANGPDRLLIEASGTKASPNYSDAVYADHPEEWSYPDIENDPSNFPGDLTADQQSEVQTTAESYWLYANTFGRASYDGNDSPMITVNDDPTIDCPNANWNGATTNYCTGVSSDDTVAHEWGHAYTEYTSGLLYQWQPGAMNEAWSDIWGETVDLLNSRFNDEDANPRTAGSCTSFTPAGLTMSFNSPSGIADCTPTPAAWSPPFDPKVTTDVVVGVDPADDAGPSTTDGCDPFTNAADIAGKFVYVDRGTCTFQVKADHATAAGATGIIVGQNSTATPIAMSGTSDIYGVMIDQATGTAIKAATSPVNVTIQPNPAATDDSKRWLIGEEDSAFGGAIRDMWNPTCYGNPGKVSDVQYYCAADDNGGVHENSGVVNHTYALLVDGGTYNGVTVPAIGLDKAANIIWQTQTTKLTPTSGFPELADDLVSACTDLIGDTSLNKLTLGAPKPGDPAETDLSATPEKLDPITTQDCDAVAAATRATELTKEPTQCNFGPMLAKDTPSLCGAGFETTTAFSENFNGGLPAGWTTDESILPGWNDEGHGYPWTAVTQADVPTGSTTGYTGGGAVYSADPDAGSCAGDANDISSRDGLTSPAITVPTGADPMLSFDHYVATESGFDGGNVKVSVNDGPFTLIPTSAYAFNAPGATLATAAAGSTDPMAGQVAFTGTDGGKVTGSWGTSYVKLDDIAAAGDTVKFRFDMGRDGCGGVDGGWYLDNVKVTSCFVTPPKSDTTVTAAPVTVAAGTAATLKVTVTGSNPTGTVTATEGATQLGSGTLSGGTASITLPATLAVGQHQVSLAYSGDGANNPSTGAATVTVTPAASTVSAPAVRTTYGSAARLHVTVAGQSPGGTVTASEGGHVLGRATVTRGSATLSLPATLAVGTHRIALAYSGDAANAAATGTTTVTVGKVASTTSISAPARAKPHRQVSVVVTVNAHGGSATGTVLVTSGGKVVGRGTLRHGKATVKVPAGGRGKLRLTASYPGSATVAPSHSRTVTVTVR